MTTAPFLAQYETICAAYPGHVVLMRLGDFLEAFNAHAETVAQVLGLVITNPKIDNGKPVRMTGFPLAAAEAQITRLIDAGYKVALAEQVDRAFEADTVKALNLRRVVTQESLF